MQCFQVCLTPSPRLLRSSRAAVSSEETEPEQSGPEQEIYPGRGHHLWEESQRTRRQSLCFLKDRSHAMKDMDIFTGSSDRGLSDFELIEEIITQDGEQSAVGLPRPCPPPADLPPQGQRSQPLRMHRQSPSLASQPVLVARGTGHPPTFPQSLLRLNSPSVMASAPPSRAVTSPASSSRQCHKNQDDTDMLDRILEKPRLVVVEEPKDRGMRFRYECEGRSAGSILGVSSTDTNKTQPAIEIQGPVEYIKRVTVTVSLVTKDLPHRPHPHCLVGKDCPIGSGICEISLNPHSSRRHSFANLGIQCVRRRELDSSLQKRRSQNIDPFQTGDTKGIEDLDMNAVRLCFQCELEWQDGRKDSLNPVVSTTIYDKKATTTSQLKITFLNQYRGSCTGKTEIYMLCDKVQKDDIEIIFRRGSWKANGEFAQTDVHRQIAIVFKTPPYQDQNLTEEVEVSVSLRRISDQMESESVTFTYLPHNPDPYEVKRKCRIKSDISFREKTCITECAPAADQHFPFQQPHTTMPPDKWPYAGPPAASAVGPVCYNAPQDSNNRTDEAALINQLLDMPAFLEMIDFDTGPDSSSTFNNMDVNFTQNFGSYTQDFSQYSDLQFNMLVNENQSVQPEPQDGLASEVQVKKEEAL
ncbi:transcription factor RelB isoform X2 [Limanda limanda]|uniref:transcription factor RelB isoform X2 n=1 Tax=Limanda limanda TaxID=27771 RepID=UPI0029C628CC|nr:transcription factor RelB isoform X2 [Limanda limanda]